ncbi:helix-turn-helix transcriptional regulator [Variovorax boronicumulans]|uniref:helix-turn-helix transcriptional regulator n=1 Tax=Variovorax boronicumulans TaxID=436515 RepID=UPI00339AAB48
MKNRVSIADLFGLPPEQARFDTSEVSAPASGKVWQIPPRYGQGRVFIVPLLGDASLALMESTFIEDTEIYANVVAQPNLSFTVCLEGSLVNVTAGRKPVRVSRHETLFARYPSMESRTESHVTSHFKGGERGCFLTIHLSPNWLEAADEAFLHDVLGNSFWHGVYNSGLASQWMLGVAREVVQCTHQPRMQWHYLSAKVLELWSQQLELLRKLSLPGAAAARMKASDLACIHQAAEILVSEMRDPPTLIELAWRVGINDNKLKSGFRLVYGTSAFSFLQKQRLQRARQLIGEEGIGVMQAAQMVGFRSPSHFSAIFKETFGVSPSGLSLMPDTAPAPPS